jgi:hypothetical protein
VPRQSGAATDPIANGNRTSDSRAQAVRESALDRHKEGLDPHFWPAACRSAAAVLLRLTKGSVTGKASTRSLVDKQIGRAVLKQVIECASMSLGKRHLQAAGRPTHKKLLNSTRWR